MTDVASQNVEHKAILDAHPARDAEAAGRLRGAHVGHRPGVVAACLAEGLVSDASAA